MTPRERHLRRLVACGLMAVAFLAAASATGQDKPPAADEWRLLESTDEMVAYKNQLRDGGFDDGSRTFLTTTALPQLGLPKNRATIDRVRRRMREVLCGDSGSDPKAATAAVQTVADFMIKVARDPKADAVYRVNAVMFVGELRGAGAKPWAAAAAPLAAVLGDDSLPPAVRIAAAAGLARQVEADPAGRAADAGPVLLKIAGSPLAGVDAIAADWLRSRAFAMLARMGAAAPAGSAAAAAKVLLDPARPVDLRVRAAAAVGSCIKAASDTDAAAAIAAIGGLATSAVTATKARQAGHDLAVRLSGGAAQPRPSAEFGVAGDATDVIALACRRDAWRLATLADALAPADGAGGLVRFAGAGAAAANALATALRDSAILLDQQPDATSLDEVITALAGGVDAAAPARAAPDAKPAAPAEPATGDGVPFGDR